MAVSLTQRAAEEVIKYLEARGGGLGVRVIVQSSECSGMAYRMVFVDAPETGDEVFESYGAKLYVDPKSLAWIEGTVIDFVQTGEENGFAFSNPNASSQCGCGGSFCV